MMRLEYTSASGWKGVLYGKSSMIIYDNEGRERVHTGSRAGDDLEYLINQVDDAPNFLEVLHHGKV